MSELKQLIQVLLVEDDASLGFVIKDNLEQQGMEVQLATDGEMAQQLFQLGRFAICILDIILSFILSSSSLSSSSLSYIISFV